MINITHTHTHTHTQIYIYIYIYIYTYTYSSLKVCWLLLGVSRLSQSSGNGERVRFDPVIYALGTIFVARGRPGESSLFFWFDEG